MVSSLIKSLVYIAESQESFLFMNKNVNKHEDWM